MNAIPYVSYSGNEAFNPNLAIAAENARRAAICGNESEVIRLADFLIQRGIAASYVCSA